MARFELSPIWDQQALIEQLQESCRRAEALCQYAGIIIAKVHETQQRAYDLRVQSQKIRANILTQRRFRA